LRWRVNGALGLRDFGQMRGSSLFLCLSSKHVDDFLMDFLGQMLIVPFTFNA
jgi:hypothetical protein